MTCGRFSARSRRALATGGKIYVVDERGNYLVHPDPSMEFGSDLGRPTQWQNDFPGLAAAFQQDRSTAMLISDRTGEKAVGCVAAIRLAGGPRVGVIEATPQAIVMAPAAAVGRSTLLVGLIALLCAGGLAVLLSRSLTRPLVQMTAAVKAFPHDTVGRCSDQGGWRTRRAGSSFPTNDDGGQRKDRLAANRSGGAPPHRIRAQAPHRPRAAVQRRRRNPPTTRSSL